MVPITYAHARIQQEDNEISRNKIMVLCNLRNLQENRGNVIFRLVPITHEIDKL